MPPPDDHASTEPSFFTTDKFANGGLNGAKPTGFNGAVVLHDGQVVLSLAAPAYVAVASTEPSFFTTDKRRRW